MARIARFVMPDIPHRIVQRIVRRVDAFFANADRKEYLQTGRLLGLLTLWRT